jgi:hypothetical protein
MSNTNFTIKMVIRENSVMPEGYIPHVFNVNSDDPEAKCPVSGEDFNKLFPGMAYATLDGYIDDPDNIFDKATTTGQVAFEQDYRSLTPVEKYYYAKFCMALIADKTGKHEALSKTAAQEAAEHQQALKNLELFDEANGLTDGTRPMSKNKRFLDHLTGKDTNPTPSPMYAYKDLDGNTILSDLKGQLTEIKKSSPIRRCTTSHQWKKMAGPSTIGFDYTKLIETLNNARRELKRLSPEEATKHEFIGATILHQVNAHHCFTDAVTLEKFLSFQFVAGDMSQLSYLQFHPQGAAAFQLGEVYHHVEALRIMGTILYVVYGDPWKNIFAPLIERIQHGDLNNLVSTTATKMEHTLLVDLITEALIEASRIVRSEEPRLLDYEDLIPKNTPRGLVADLTKVLTAIPNMADPTTLSNRLVLFQAHNEYQSLSEEIAKAQGKDSNKRKAGGPPDDGPRPKRDATARPRDKTKDTTAKAEKDLCLKSIFVQWRGPKIFNDKNTPGHQACLDPKTCTRVHQPFKQMAKSDLQAALAQGPTIFGADNWEAKNYAERLLADNSNSKFSCPYFPDGTPRTPDKVAEIRAKRGNRTPASRKPNGDN